MNNSILRIGAGAAFGAMLCGTAMAQLPAPPAPPPMSGLGPVSTMTSKTGVYNNGATSIKYNTNSSNITTGFNHNTVTKFNNSVGFGSQSLGGVHGTATTQDTFAISGSTAMGTATGSVKGNSPTGTAQSFQLSGGFATPGSGFSASGDGFGTGTSSYIKNTNFTNTGSMNTIKNNGVVNTSFTNTKVTKTIKTNNKNQITVFNDQNTIP